MATIHLLGGKAGAGKTTLARELGRTLPAVVFCEDEWIATLGFTIRSLDDFLDADRRVRALIGGLVPDLLRHGVSVVLDLAAGNTVAGRAWLRSLFEAAGADHVLHWLDADDDECLAAIHHRNTEQPPGVYWGHVSDEMFRAVTPHVAAPSPAEGFHVVRRARGPRATNDG